MSFRPLAILRILLRHQVDFVIVGGVAGSLAGSPVATADLDLVYATESENIKRLLGALRELNASYKDPAGRSILPDADKLAEIKVNLLRTDAGDLDLLQRIGKDLHYADLVHRSVEYALEDLRVRAIDLETLIEAKEVAGRPKDRYALQFLRPLLDMARSTPDKPAS